MPHNGPQARHDDPRSETNVLMLVGQLLEATKAATEGIKSLSVEVKQHSHSIVTILHTVETLERSCAMLDRIVRTSDSGQDSLVHRTATHQNLLDRLTATVAEMKEAAEEVRDQLSTLDSGRSQLAGAWKLLGLIGFAFVQILTLAIAAYAALAAGK